MAPCQDALVDAGTAWGVVGIVGVIAGIGATIYSLDPPNPR